MPNICLCQDSAGDVCGKSMTKEEVEQDGMCSVCADNVYEEMVHNNDHKWYHSSPTNE